jgi:hypothetical protein
MAVNGESVHDMLRKMLPIRPLLRRGGMVLCAELEHGETAAFA